MTPGSRRLLVAAAIVLPAALHAQRARGNTDWPAYGNDRGGARHSTLTQIDTRNVASLAVAWRFSTGEAGPGYETGRRTSFEATPLVVQGTMYFTTPLGRTFALDAATGREKWRFNPGVARVARFGDFASRGVSWWVDERAPRGSRCRARIIVATIDARLIALDAADGATCPSFGDGGTVDLRRSLRNAPFEWEEYEVTSPPAIANGVIVVGSAVADNNRADAASGEVRGYDARTGALRWTWDPVPQDPRDAAYGTWRGANAHRTGAANAWSVIAVDSARGLVFVPTSSPSPDYFGGTRLGDNRYANSIVALRATTGAVVWSFQTVHHDLWDYDNAAPPLLATVRAGRDVDVVMQATKSGMLYVLDRETGAPVFPVEERAVPRSAIAGEEASPTQPFSGLPPLSPHRLTAADAFGADSADRAWCAGRIASLRNEGIFTPPDTAGTLVVPSNIGGAHWGGLAWYPATQLVVLPVNEVAAEVQLIPTTADTTAHAEGFEYTRMRGTPWTMRRRILVSPKGVPCTRPPFGSLVAVSLATGKLAWSVPLGSPVPPTPTATRDTSGARGLTRVKAAAADSAQVRELGSPNLGGAITTAGGLVFIAATLDWRLRAYDVANGRELWRAPLPAGGKATPMTYMVNGRQYVAIAAGGDGAIFGKGDEIVVFALPNGPAGVRR